MDEAGGAVVIEAGVAAGYMIAWAVRKARRVGGRLDAEADGVIAAGLDRLHEVVVGKLGGHPALAELVEEAEAAGEVSALTKQQVELALTAAARKDGLFGQELRELVARLWEAEQAAGGTVIAGAGSVVFTGGSKVTAEHGAFAFGPVGGDVHISQGPGGSSRSASGDDASDRIAVALERLGSSQPAIRVGAVRALAEIAAAVPGERAGIAQILSAHLRSEAPAPGPDGDGCYLLPPLQVRLPVAQAIITVLANGLYPELDLSHADLCRANLADRKLRSADLRKVNLRCADLTRADLRGADLRGADMTGAKVTGALLAEAKLTDARLAELDLTGIDLSGVELIRVDMSRSNLAGVDLSGRDDLYYAKFRYADLTGANLAGAELRGAQFDYAKLPNADLSQARMVRASFEGADLDGARMRHADLAKADLSHASLKDTDLRRAMLEQANLTGAYLSGTDLRGAWLRDANLSQIAHMNEVRIDRRTREDGKLRYRSPTEVLMDVFSEQDDL